VDWPFCQRAVSHLLWQERGEVGDKARCHLYPQSLSRRFTFAVWVKTDLETNHADCLPINEWWWSLHEQKSWRSWSGCHAYNQLPRGHSSQARNIEGLNVRRTHLIVACSMSLEVRKGANDLLCGNWELAAYRNLRTSWSSTHTISPLCTCMIQSSPVTLRW